MLCAASLLFFAVGAGIAIIMNNLLLVPVLAAGMMFLPFWYIKLTARHYRKAVTAELETALSIITTAYLRSEDLQTAVEAVSYTHLDVYKRQRRRWWIPCSKRRNWRVFCKSRLS